MRGDLVAHLRKQAGRMPTLLMRDLFARAAGRIEELEGALKQACSLLPHDVKAPLVRVLYEGEDEPVCQCHSDEHGDRVHSRTCPVHN